MPSIAPRPFLNHHPNTTQISCPPPPSPMPSRKLPPKYNPNAILTQRYHVLKRTPKYPSQPLSHKLPPKYPPHTIPPLNAHTDTPCHRLKLLPNMPSHPPNSPTRTSIEIDNAKDELWHPSPLAPGRMPGQISGPSSGLLWHRGHSVAPRR